jgi:2-hydroxychromene-2-carboxylate isomerase
MSTAEFFYDFSSPFSYLAATQIERVCRGHELVWRPFLLGALFKAIGTPVVPIQSFAPAKSALLLKDQFRWAEHWGVELNQPSRFPQRTVLALRVALQVPKDQLPALSLALFRTMWVEDGNLEDPASIAAVLERHGIAAAPLIAGAETQEVKDRLRQNTDEAVARGACGAPTRIVTNAGAKDLVFWGQDRLHFVERALAGWVPRNER